MKIRSTIPFVVDSWRWDPANHRLECHYSHAQQRFCEEITFTAAGGDLTPELCSAFDLILICAGVSYYKLFASATIELRMASVGEPIKAFVEQLYDHGLREFAVTNGLSIPFVPDVVVAPREAAPEERSSITSVRASALPEDRDLNDVGQQLRPLIAMGGGRDSLLVAAALAGMDPILFVVGENSIVRAQAAHLGLPLVTAHRALDPLMLEMNAQGAMNGHVPVTAINSTISIAAALLNTRSHVVMSNERSASEPTMTVDAIPVNHQYSKGIHFESALRDVMAALGMTTGYFSALRPYGELAISAAIGRRLHELPPFVSCNRAFVRIDGVQPLTWCTHCAKCYFVFLGLAPFVARPDLVRFFGRDLLDARSDVEALTTMLVGPGRSFDCIGTPEEVAVAVHLASRGGWSDSVPLAELAATTEPPSAAAVEFLLGAHQPDHIPDGFRRFIASAFR